MIRACFGAAGDGGLVLCGAVTLNSTLALATMEPDDVINSTAEKAAETLKAAAGRNAIAYSCAARWLALGAKTMAEHEKLAECFGGALPYFFAYSGGEIFPDRLSDGSTANHLQNDSIIICVI